MTKHKYNQGDLLRYHWSKAEAAQLFVIIRVFSESYEVLWPAGTDQKPPIKSYYFSTLDDSDDITLVARG